MPENGQTEGETLFSSDDEADQSIDWESEELNIEERKEWFKPPEGKTKIKFLDNGHKEKREYDGEERDVAVFKIEVDGEEMLWSVTCGTTPTSLYGQITEVAAKNGHSLEGVEIHLLRKGTKSDTSYTIPEAMD